VNNIHILAFTHRQLEVSQIGHLHIEVDNQKDRLQTLKKELALDELLFLSTCNRVEFIFKTGVEVDEHFITRFMRSLYPNFDEAKIKLFSSSYEYYYEINAVKHFLKVAASVDSMIIGEREIITQVRQAYETCSRYGLTNDSIRLLIRFTIETAKRIYTETNIAQRPVSVVSLAYHTLKSKNIPLEARVLVIGAGVTNANMLRFLKKHGFKNFAIFNRTYEKAVELAAVVKGEAFPLSELDTYTKGFDVIITCTGAEEPIISKSLYTHLLQGETVPKTVIDLAIPHDLEAAIPQAFAVEHISVDYLQTVSRKNLKERTKEIIYVDQIIAEAVLTYRNMCKEREVERAMQSIPEEVKKIKSTALEHVFAEEFKGLDDQSRETLEKIINHFEKKYISVPMKMAKEILLNK
jgi:glutamyl-tRNA reductase